MESDYVIVFFTPEKEKTMVLPTDLINYVKEQLGQNIAVGTIIGDIRAKGYQISSSTIYKIRATMAPRPITTGISEISTSFASPSHMEPVTE